MYLKQTDCFITRCSLFQPCEEANKVSVNCKQGFFLFQGQNSLQFEVQRSESQPLINICLHKHKYISRGNLLFKAGIKGFQACKIEQKLKAVGNIKALVYKPSIFCLSLHKGSWHVSMNFFSLLIIEIWVYFGSWDW